MCDLCKNNIISEKQIIETLRSRPSILTKLDFVKARLINIAYNLEYLHFNIKKETKCYKIIINFIKILFTNFFDNLIENNLNKNMSKYEKNEIEEILHKYPEIRNKYYYKLFGIPYILMEINIPKENYEYRKKTYFNDLIAGHPYASHGWAYESYNNILELESNE